MLCMKNWFVVNGFVVREKSEFQETFYLQIIIFDWLLLKQKSLVLLYTSFKVMWNKVVFVWMFIYLQYWVKLSNITFYVVCKILQSSTDVAFVL